MDEEDPFPVDPSQQRNPVDPFHAKFQQRYPVNELFINERKMDDKKVRGEFFGVLLSADPLEQRAFALMLLRKKPDPLTLDDDIKTTLGDYGREAPLQEIVNFLMFYVKNPNKTSALASSSEAEIDVIRANMKPRIAEALIPKKSYWGFRGGRKTKKSKRRQRKTRRRHK